MLTTTQPKQVSFKQKAATSRKISLRSMKKDLFKDSLKVKSDLKCKYIFQFYGRTYVPKIQKVALWPF